MVGPSIEDRLRGLNERIDRACLAAGRSRAEVRLLAVSKLHDLESILAARRAGQTDFGENYVREAVSKIDAWRSEKVDWHFIGRLQGNKVRQVANRFAYVHSIERFEIAERLDRATESRQDVFIQMNVADEASKGGISAGEVVGLVERIDRYCPKLRIRGLMVMPPLDEDPERARPYFRTARETLADLNSRGFDQPLDQLSMGTSGDFAVAIAEGATWIRIGTDVFGPRVRAT